MRLNYRATKIFLICFLICSFFIVGKADATAPTCAAGKTGILSAIPSSPLCSDSSSPTAGPGTSGTTHIFYYWGCGTGTGDSCTLDGGTFASGSINDACCVWTNQSPTIGDASTTQTYLVGSGQTATLSVTASDPEGDLLYDWSCAHGGVTDNTVLPTSRTGLTSPGITFTSPTVSVNTIYTCTVTVREYYASVGLLSSVDKTIDVTVVPLGNAVCGSSHEQTFTTAPTTNLCSVGVPSATVSSGTNAWLWICDGSSGMSDAGCFALERADGVCGSANDQAYYSAPTTGLCSVGTATTVSGTGPYTWSCNGVNGGTAASCSTAVTWYSGWSYRKPITISNTSGSDLTNYQIKVTVAYDSDMQADFDDIRFVSSNNATTLNYWLESKTDSSTATVWVKVPSIPTAGTTIYMYYGNASASTASSGDNTFEFFDNFDGSSVDTSKWQSGSACTVASSIATCLTSASVSSKLTYGNGYAFRTYVKSTHSGVTSYYEEPISLSDGASNQIYFRAATSTGTPPKYGNYNGSYSEVAATGWAAGSYKIAELKRLSTGAYWTVNDADSVSNTSNYSSASMYAGFGVANIGSTGSQIDTDWFLIRKVVATEPTNSTGSEQTPATCGSSHGQTFTTAPTTNLCTVGTASSVAGSGPWTWTCTGTGGQTANCSTAAAWYSSWSARKLITISNASGSDLTNYQIKVTVAYDSDMQADFDDIRFASTDNVTLLNYWLESKTDSSTATVWVKVPSIPTAGTTIYMYYGNASASTASSGDNTFEFFDDFASSLDTTNKWTVNSSQSYSISSGILTVSGANDASDYILSKTTFGLGYALRSYSRWNNASGSSFWGFHDTVNDGAVFYDTAGYRTYATKSGTGSADGSNATTGATLYIYEIQRISSALTKFYQGATLWNTVTSTSYITTASRGIEMRQYSNGYSQAHDWVAVRKIVATEPTNSFSSEESSATATCGTSNGQILSSAPTTNLCTLGIASSVSGSGPWTWTCTSANNLVIASCSATLSGNSWLAGWADRKSISISSGSNLTDYQIKVAVTYNSHMNSDFSDLRFTDSGHTTTLNYWVESYTASTSAVVWVKVPSISSSGTTIYMYYGNSGAATASSGDNTFVFFDHFLGSSLSGWTADSGLTYSVGSSYLTITGANASTWNTNYGFHKALSSSISSYAIRASLRFTTTVKTELTQFSIGPVVNNYGNGIGDGGAASWPYQNSFNGTANYSYSAAGTYSTVMETKRWGSGANQANNSFDEGTAVSGTLASDLSQMDIRACRYSTYAFYTKAESDWVLVRKYVQSEPTNTVNSEETGSGAACGTSNGQSLSSAPATNLCTTGTASSVSGSGPWTWTCTSTDGLSVTSCIAINTGASWLTGWEYRKPITVSNSSGSTLTNYQVKLAVTYNSHMKSDFSDLRFADSSHSAVLNYWIESYTAGTSAVVWVKVPSIPTAGTTIYMYYGNASIPTASSGDNTFELFDDFTGASLDTTNKWTTGYSTGGSATVASSQLNFQVVGSAAGPWSSIYSKTTFDVNYALRAKLKTNISGAYSFPSQRGSYFGLNSKAAAMYAYGATDLAGKYYNTNSSDAQAITGFSASTWVIQDIYRNASTSCIYKINDANTVTISNGVTTGAVPAYFMLYAYTAAGTVTQDVDWFLVRKYVGTEPTNTINAEQSSLNGYCGTANATTVSSAPTTNLCATGTASSVATGAATYTWTCSGSAGGSTANCYANKTGTTVNGLCGAANYVTASSAPLTDLCSAGTATSVITNATVYSWTCGGLNGGTNDDCEANISGQTVPGSCGAADGQNFTSAPTTNLCATSNGVPTINGTGPWTWTCYGSSPAGDVSCSANKALPKWHETSPN